MVGARVREYMAGIDCPMCFAGLTQEKPNRAYGGDGTLLLVLREAEGPISINGRAVNAPECDYLGRLLLRKDDPLRRWHVCEHPSKPLGAEVCACKGCGPKCPGYKIEGEVMWAYGVTTCKQRRTTLLPATLESLAKAGFPAPRLFVDGDPGPWSEFNLDATYRNPAIRSYGSWVLGLAELYIRNPNATRYAMFQDDFVAYRNLRQYLESCTLRERTYWNLYTFPENQKLAKEQGFFPSNQRGKGAVGLVFDRKGVLDLLANQHTVGRPMDSKRGHESIDGGVVTALKKVGYVELCHSPSLVQHTGHVSSMGHRRYAEANSWMGEDFDALHLVTSKVP